MSKNILNLFKHSYVTSNFCGCKRSINHQILSKRKFCSPASAQVLDIKSPEIAKKDIFSDSLKHEDFFGVAKLFSVENLFHANVHMGHKDGSLNDYMRPFIFGSRLNHLIIDLDLTSVLLRDALNFTAHIAFRKGIILFVCRSAQHQLLIEKTASESGEYSHTREWNFGTLTNSTKYFGSITRLPDLIIFINTLNNVLTQHEAVADAARMRIPTIGIVDTNCDPRILTYPVPGNDDSSVAVKLYCKLFKEAIMLGKNKRKMLAPES